MAAKLFTDFSGGLDTRQGVIHDDAKRFSALENVIITPGRKPNRRPPLLVMDGEIDTTTCKGLVQLDGQWTMFAPKGTTPANTLDGGVDVRFFDLPDYCTADDWELVQAGIYGTSPYAVIKHGYNGGAVTNIVKLHLWDERDQKPTYVEDPSCPTNWKDELPLFIYGKGVAGSFSDYRPATEVVSNKLHMTRPDCNTAICKTNDARVWNSRSSDQVLAQGDLYYFVQPDDPSGLYSFTVSLPYADLLSDSKWAAYVAELMLDDGTWLILQEVAGLPIIPNTYRPQPATSRFGGGDEIRLEMRLSNIPGRILRFRAIAKAAPVTIISGGRFDPGKVAVVPQINDAKIQFQGATIDAPKITLTIPPGSAGKTFLVGLPVPGMSIDPLREVLTPGVSPYNGWERYHLRILARAIVDPTNAFFLSTLAGTVSVTALSNAIKGVGTLFTTSLLVGDRVLVNGEERAITTIVDDLNAVADNVFTITSTGVPIQRRQTYFYASDVSAGNAWYVQKEVEAITKLAGLGSASFINTAFYDNSGTPPTMLVQLKNRLGVFFEQSFQLWLTDPIPTAYQFLDSISVGTGRNTRPVAADVNGDILAPTDNGVRAFQATGLNYDAAEDQNLGEILDGTKLPPLSAAAWWPYKNLYVTAGAEGGVLTVLALTVIRGTRTNAWSTFTFAGISQIDKIIPDGERLYFLCGSRLYYLDGLGTDFKDANDADDLPYASRGRWRFMHFGAPNVNKRMLFMDVEMNDGGAEWRWFPNPCLPDAALGPIVLRKGPSWGRTRIPLACMGAAIAFEFLSRSRTGFRLESIMVEFTPTRR